MLKTIVIVACIYLYASIPFSLLIGFLFGKDIRNEGSGNVGGTNLGRTCGSKAFVLGFIMDLSKGALAVLIAGNLGFNPLLAGVIAILGHTFSVFLNFKGGKGVATAFGFVLAYSFAGAIFAITIFLVVLGISKYVSLSSIIAIFAYFVYTIFFQTTFYSIAIFIVFCFVTLLHSENIKRIKAGTERKITWM